MPGVIRELHTHRGIVYGSHYHGAVGRIVHIKQYEVAAVFVFKAGVEVDQQSVSFGSRTRCIGMDADAVAGEHAMGEEIVVSATKRDAENPFQMPAHAFQSLGRADHCGRSFANAFRESGAAVKEVEVSAFNVPRKFVIKPDE